MFKTFSSKLVPLTTSSLQVSHTKTAAPPRERNRMEEPSKQQIRCLGGRTNISPLFLDITSELPDICPHKYLFIFEDLFYA